MGETPWAVNSSWSAASTARRLPRRLLREDSTPPRAGPHRAARQHARGDSRHPARDSTASPVRCPASPPGVSPAKHELARYGGYRAVSRSSRRPPSNSPSVTSTAAVAVRRGGRRRPSVVPSSTETSASATSSSARKDCGSSLIGSWRSRRSDGGHGLDLRPLLALRRRRNL